MFDRFKTLYKKVAGAKRDKELKKFDREFKESWWQKAFGKRAEANERILSPDLLRRRDELTKAGKENLVLQFGAKGTKQYTLQDLNKMAAALKKAKTGFKEKTRGVPIPQLIRASRIPVNYEGKRLGLSDFSKAVQEIRNAILYKIKGNLLTFRVTASGQTEGKTHYQVRIRLEDWFSRMTSSGSSYMESARQACMGRISFDCTCGRHQYWYRYLATIGGFGLDDPMETGFPKIRNPGLRGACCKHVVKTLAVLQQGAIHVRLSNEMKEQAQEKGWVTKMMDLVTGAEEKEQWVAKSDLPEMDEAGDLANIKKEFKAFTNAKAGFSKKVQKQETRNKMEELRKAQAAAKAYEQIARNENRMRIEREKDVLTKDVEIFLVRSIYGEKKMTKGQAVKEYAQAKRMDIKEVQQIADKIQV